MRITQISVNRTFADEVGPDGVRAYVEALVAAERESKGQPASKVREIVAAQLEARHIAVPRVTVERLAEDLSDPNSDDLVIMGPDGQALHGEPQTQTEDTADQSEPESSDRPAYS